jgi:hypothetical protein
MERQNYGTYDSNTPMKTFSGQPSYVTQSQFVRTMDPIINRVQEIQGHSDLQKGFKNCDVCPKSKEQCNAISDPTKRNLCLQTYKVCKNVCL